MLRARRFDEALMAHADLVPGVYHVSVGLEATAAGLACVRRPEDAVMLNHRNHGHLAAIGSDLETMYREIFGRAGGPQRGRAGTLHLCDPGRGVPYTSAMVAGGVTLAVGMALAKARTGAAGIALPFFGDGAMGEGAMHESLNIARLWDLPVLFVCESNATPAGGRTSALHAAASLATLAAANGIAATTVDARRPAEVVAAMETAAAEIRGGGGPRFVEAVSQPWPGNAAFLPRDATGPFDVAAAVRETAHTGWEASDPVACEARMLAAEGVDPAAMEAVDEPIRAEVGAAVRAAAAAPPAPGGAPDDGVWAPA
jgi:TPP-dependent pyruvate/acetoin dehydrogenase alpha subunit